MPLAIVAIVIIGCYRWHEKIPSTLFNKTIPILVILETLKYVRVTMKARRPAKTRKNIFLTFFNIYLRSQTPRRKSEIAVTRDKVVSFLAEKAKQFGKTRDGGDSISTVTSAAAARRNGTAKRMRLLLATIEYHTSHTSHTAHTAHTAHTTVLVHTRISSNKSFSYHTRYILFS